VEGRRKYRGDSEKRGTSNPNVIARGPAGGKASVLIEMLVKSTNCNQRERRPVRRIK
jgi:hypothetical protein